MYQTILNQKQSELLETLIVKYGQIVTSQQIFEKASPEWDYKQAKNLITKLVKHGWLVRIKRGLYAISDLSSRGYLSLSPAVIANLLVVDSYVSFETALYEQGFSDQMTSKVVSISLRSYPSTKLSGLEYSFVKTSPKYYFGWHAVPFQSYVSRIATPEKALIDLINFHRSQYSIDLVIEIIMEHREDLEFERLIHYLKSSPIIVVKIFGFAFDLIGIESDQLQKMITTRSTHRMLAECKKFDPKWRLYYTDFFDSYKKYLDRTTPHSPTA